MKNEKLKDLFQKNKEQKVEMTKPVDQEVEFVSDDLAEKITGGTTNSGCSCPNSGCSC
ncbi:hypothetical protein [Sphingobacterium sp. R2]|uniref:hypothetical protein n=1 Tax=Sphingobacterium sp. R2 TaxID=3112958 RepID=UPI00345CEAE1